MDVKELVRSAKGVKEEDVQEAVNTVREVESLGGTRAQYNIAPPFGSLTRRSSKPTDPRTVKLKTRRR
jgi:hypothetical protein